MRVRAESFCILRLPASLARLPEQLLHCLPRRLRRTHLLLARSRDSTFVAAIIDQQTGCQAALARTQGTQEAAVKRLSRLLHNERLKPKDCRDQDRQTRAAGSLSPHSEPAEPADLQRFGK